MLATSALPQAPTDDVDHLQHYVLRYYTGENYDCGRSDCKLSSAHVHKTAKTCFCNTVRVRDFSHSHTLTLYNFSDVARAAQSPEFIPDQMR
jgi:hypothetical protein